MSALVVAFVAAALGQQRAHVRPNDDGIVRGTVVAASTQSIEVRDARGEVRRIPVDASTLVMTDDEDFSVANLPDIRIAPTDLAKGDVVEVIVEGARRAGIVTRISPIEPTTTARAARAARP